MYSQPHQQGPGARLNGAGPGRQMPALFNFQPPGHQPHLGHHQPMQPDHGAHVNNGPLLSHHGGFSAALLNSSPYGTPSVIQNGQTPGPVGRVLSQPQPVSEFWAEQQRVYKDCQQANAIMLDSGQPHYYARMKAPDNKLALQTPEKPGAAQDGEQQDDRRKPRGADPPPVVRQEWHNLDLSGQGFKHLALQVCRYTFLQELYVPSNKLRSLPPAIGQLRQLRHLDASFNRISGLPAEIGMCTYLKNLLLFDNDLRTLPYEMGSLYMLEMLGIDGNPHLDVLMKQELMERGTKSLIKQLRENSTEPPPPPPRQLVVIQEDVSPSLEMVRVFSWNVLCDKYATQQTYGYAPASALSWEYRRACIMEEIRLRDADIMCLQEISTEAFAEFFGPELATLDYKGVHRPKTRAKTMGDKDAQAVDGCALFFKTSKFILINMQVIDFTSIAINRPDMKNQHDVFNRVMPKDNIAVVSLLESRNTGSRIIVVCVHLAWEQTLADVKLIQTGILMERITALAEEYARRPPLKDKDRKIITLSENGHESKPPPPPPPSEPVASQEYRNNTDIPLIVCGDFNSTIGSSVYNLMSQGRVPPDHGDIVNFQYGNFTRDGIEHPFSLRDAYAPLKGLPDELPFTNYTPGFTDVIDYIFYSTNTLEIVSLLGPPDPDYLRRVPAFPFYHFPADHIQIMAEFVVKARKDKKLPEPDFGPSASRG